MVDRGGAWSMNDPRENPSPSEEKCSDEEFCGSENMLSNKDLDGTGKIPEAKKQSLASMLEDKCKDLELFEDYDGVEYAHLKRNGHFETHRIESHAFKKILSKRYSDAFQKGISETVIDEVCLTLKAKAGNGKKHVVSYRIAGDGNDFIEIDLGNENYDSIHVNRINGTWEEPAPHKSRFIRSPSMRPLPYPTRGGSLSTIRKFVNISDEGAALYYGFLLMAVHPKACLASFPIGALRGEHGSGKSMAARIMRSLVDPSRTDVRTMVRDPRDFPALLKNAHLLNFDNVGSIPEWLSNDLCTISTGGALGARKLYSDDEDLVYDAHAPLLLNGITDFATKPDFLDRIYAIYLDSIPEERRRTRAAIEREWEIERAGVFGALLDGLLLSMQRRGEIEAQNRPLSRMADAAVIIIAAEDLFDLPPGTFERALAGQREEAAAFVLDTPLGLAFKAFKEAHLHSEIEWEGTQTELLGILARFADPGGKGLPKPWPGNARAFSNKRKEMEPDLRRGYGLHFFAYPRNRQRMILVSRMPFEADRGEPSLGLGDASGGGRDEAGNLASYKKACNHAGETLTTQETQNLYPSYTRHVIPPDPASEEYPPKLNGKPRPSQMIGHDADPADLIGSRGRHDGPPPKDEEPEELPL
jgi:hypothetical protein